MSVLGTKAKLHDWAPYVVNIRLVRGRSAGRVTFTQTVPGRPYRTPREQLPLRPREPAEFELRFSGQPVEAAFDVALRGAPGESFIVDFLLAHGSARSGDREEPIDEARFELGGVVSIVGFSHTIELAYDGTTAGWRTLPPGRPVIWRKRPARPDWAPKGRRGLWPEPEREPAKSPAGLRHGRKESEPTREPPLHEAAKAFDVDTVRSLLERGADVHARGVFQETPLHAAVRSVVFVWMHTPRQLAVVQQLLDAGADPNARNSFGATPLHTALEDLHFNGSANVDVVKLLLLRGADPDARRADGLRPADRSPTDWGHMSPAPRDVFQRELARRSALERRVDEMLDAARRGTLG